MVRDTMQDAGVHSLPAIRSLLGSWFAANQRPLPWRQEYDPYQVWISEIMGQQTQMDRVVEYFLRWMEAFPTIEALAAAEEDRFLKLWEGLGYYSRARNLRKAARVMIENHQGRIPDQHDALLRLPGVGPYTAAAILSIAFDQPVPLIDANVERVCARLADLDGDVKSLPVRKELERLVADLLDRRAPRLHNQAMMEFGALVCLPRSPACARCPLQPHCLAYRRGTVAMRPTPRPRKQKIDIEMACAIIHWQGAVYIQKRLPDDVWGGLWEFPGGRLKPGEGPEQAVRREVYEETSWRLTETRLLETVVHFYTRYRVTLHGFVAQVEDPEQAPMLHAATEYRWVRPMALAEFSFPSGHRQLLRHLVHMDFAEELGIP